MKIKNIIILFPADSSTDILDVLIELEDDAYSINGYTYVVEVSTPQGLANLMEKDNFLPPTELIIIIKELTKEIIEEAIQALVEAKENAYWLKLYHTATELDINHLNAALDLQKKRRLD